MKRVLTFLVLFIGGCSEIPELAFDKGSNSDSWEDAGSIDSGGDSSGDSDWEDAGPDTESEQSTDIEDTETASEDSTDEGVICDPGETQVCICTTGTEGAQSCSNDGQSWNPCECAEDDTDSADTDDTVDTDTVDTDPGICEYITCPEYPEFNPGTKYRSRCIESEFPGVLPDTIVHYAQWSGECYELEEGGYECRYKEHVEECELEQYCAQQYIIGDPGYTGGICLQDEN